MKPVVLPLLLLVIASAAHGSADSAAMDEQAAEEVAFFQFMLDATIQKGQEILSAIEQHISKLQGDGGDPREQEIEEPLLKLQNDGSNQAIEGPPSESQDDQEDGDKQSKQGNEESLSKLQDRLVGVQDGDSDGLHDLTDAQDDDDEDAVDIQALQSILKDTQEGKSDARAKRAADKQAPAAKIQEWTKSRFYENHQKHYYILFVNMAKSYMRHYSNNNKVHYERILKTHMDRSYNNFITQMNKYFGSLYKKIENYIPRYVKNPQETKMLLKELSNGGKKLSKKALIFEEPSRRD